MSASELLNRLDGVRRTGHGRFVSKCPAHEDRAPSLSVRELDNGRILVHCFAGCEVQAVVESVGLNMSDLFPRRSDDYDRRQLRSGIHPMDALACVAHEARIVLIAGRDIAGGTVLPDADLDRLALAVQRIGAAIQVAHA